MPIVKKQSDWVRGRRNTASPSQAGVCNFERFEIDAPTLVAGDILEIGILPADCTIVDAILDTADLDSNGTPLLTLDAGLVDGTVGDALTSRTCGNELFAASTVGRAGGMERVSKQLRITKAKVDRSIGVRCNAAPATSVTGKIFLTVFFGQ